MGVPHSYSRMQEHALYAIEKLQSWELSIRPLQKFRVKNRMNEKFYGIKFRNFGYTLRGCRNVPEKSLENFVPFGHS